MDTKQFPYLEIAGSHREVGSAIGETFRTSISRFIEKRKSGIPQYQAYIPLLTPYIQAVTNTFPHYLEEMEGVAEGSGVTMEDYFFANTRELYLTPEELYGAGAVDHCTTIVATENGKRIIGHNEDWSKEAIDDLFVLKATIDDITFLCLDYTTYLSGSAASVNSMGVSQCINDLSGTKGPGVPTYFAARAVLETKSADEAVSMLKSTQWASGFNHVITHNGVVWNVELSAGNTDAQRIDTLPYVHTNHFLSPKMISQETHRSESSVQRYSRAVAVARSEMHMKDMRSLLSDTVNAAYPICRKNETIASVIIKPQDGVMHICYGKPDEGQYVRYSV